MSEFAHLEVVSDEQDYEYIKGQSLAWVVAIEDEVKSGKTPEQIADWWGDEYKREAMRERIYHAARHIERGLRAQG